jgi:hypothetical protein
MRTPNSNPLPSEGERLRLDPAQRAKISDSKALFAR